jgi:hypothetical protein
MNSDLYLTHTPRILQEFNTYYNQLLGTKHQSSLNPNLTPAYDTSNPYTTTSLEAQGDDRLRPLIDPISLNEIKQAMFALPKGKASGPDGYLIKFFQTYWDIVKEDISQVITAFYHNKLDL